MNPIDTESNADEEELRKAIEDFYLPRNLVRAIHEIGQIPAHSTESHVGIGFIDIADYTYLSKFLSPKENQIILNGLYTAFQIVLERHGGYLNKIEGDSMMFHFDGIINVNFRKLQPVEQMNRIARELFYTCIEMQRVCALFNQANDSFIDNSASQNARKALADAFGIISDLRNKSDASNALHAFFQIRIRIGANLGEVTIGNFGPDGAKQWDVIGLPVINAKRMESTAPIGGLRISESFYELLTHSGVTDAYVERFRREATLMGSVYKNIKKDELFAFRQVVIPEKRNASFRTYAVQVDPALPEHVVSQVQSLLSHGDMGTQRILEFIQYYRGNVYVIDLLEQQLVSNGISIRKSDIFRYLQPQADPVEVAKAASFKLSELFKLMDRFQDAVQQELPDQTQNGFEGYNQTMKAMEQSLKSQYEKRKFILVQKTYFFEVAFPLVFTSLRTAINEYQTRDVEPMDLEVVVD